MCFYTNRREAFQNGLPSGQFQPNFAARLSKSLEGDGLFHVKLKTFKGTYPFKFIFAAGKSIIPLMEHNQKHNLYFNTATRAGAMAYIRKHRNVAPGLYNEARLREAPIPETRDDSDDELPVEEEVLIPVDAIDNGENVNNEMNQGMNPLLDPLGESPNVSIDNGRSFRKEILVSVIGTSDVSTGHTVHSDVVANAIGGSGPQSIQNHTPAPPIGADDASTGHTVHSNAVANVVGGSSSQSVQNRPPAPPIGTDDTSTGRTVTSAVIAEAVSNSCQEVQSPVQSTSPNVGGSGTNERRSMNEAKPDVAEILPIFEMRSDDAEILEELEEKLVETLTIEGEKIEITYTATKGFGKPFNATADYAIKLEEPDLVSGMIPFILTVH